MLLLQCKHSTCIQFMVVTLKKILPITNPLDYQGKSLKLTNYTWRPNFTQANTIIRPPSPSFALARSPMLLVCNSCFLNHSLGSSHPSFIVVGNCSRDCWLVTQNWPIVLIRAPSYTGLGALNVTCQITDSSALMIYLFNKICLLFAASPSNILTCLSYPHLKVSLQCRFWFWHLNHTGHTLSRCCTPSPKSSYWTLHFTFYIS